MEKGTTIAKKNCSVDHKKVRVLLMDTNIETCQEILSVLCNCSYKVIPVWQAPEVHGVLMSFSGSEVDLILAEAELLMANNAQVMTFIMRTTELRNIPVIMLSRQEDIPMVMEGLKLGAADYLMKPIHTNELSNIWMHTIER